MSTSELLPGEKVDLTNCDREPIHVPGSIQPHGAMLVLSEPELLIVQVSENTHEHFGITPDELLGQPLARLMGIEEIERLREDVLRTELEATPRYLPPLAMGMAGTVFERILHRYHEVLILECEPRQQGAGTQLDLYPQLKVSLTRLERTSSVREFCQRAAEQVRAFTGYDRVMVYKFMGDDSGSVIAEDKRENLESFLGLHYPASDIPKQARTLYLKSWLRFVVDVNVEPVPLRPVLNPQTTAPLDMSHAVTRSTSPIHREYLHNMGVRASLSISLVKDGKLWGLVACHHYSAAKNLSHDQRMACEFLAHLLSLQMASKEIVEDHEYAVRINQTHARLVEVLAKEELFWWRGLNDAGDDLARYVEASGVAICGQQVRLFGRTPDEAQVRELVTWLKENSDADVFATNRLPELYPEMDANVASGLLAAHVSKRLGECVLWFRPAEVTVVNWAGDPNKPVTVGEHGARLTPRQSFALWQETVENKSAPWKAVEIEAARMLRRSIFEVVMRRAEELAKLNEELERSNSDLDSFAYIASHDLKEPLRGIHNFSHFLLEDYGDKLDKEGVEQLQTLVRLSERLESLLDSLLHYSRVGRATLELEEVEFRELVDDSLELVSTRLKESGALVSVAPDLPRVMVDRNGMTEVLTNLITNAVKYNNKPEKRVEIGMVREMSVPGGLQAVRAFYVKDNGIGIPDASRETVFRIFKRLHGRNEYGGGSGLGLTIVKKIVERHGGKVWSESKQDVGTTFFFTLEREGFDE